MNGIKTVLISVSDKKDLDILALGLINNGYTIISTGGTGAYLQDNGIDFVSVESFTGFTEIMNGRVKTLHPSIFAGILSRRKNANDSVDLQKIGATTIDIVVVNLYPFVATVAKKNTTLDTALENIDIGGVSLLRAAAKNYKDVLVLCDTNDYSEAMSYLENREISNQQNTSKEFEHYKLLQAKKSFDYTASYDTHIASYFKQQVVHNKKVKKIADIEPSTKTFSDTLCLYYRKHSELRYGENPHQEAALYVPVQSQLDSFLYGAKQLYGKQLSYNNLRDTQASLRILKTQFIIAKKMPTVKQCTHFIQNKKEEQNRSKKTFAIAVGVKHGNPCAVANATNIEQAWDSVHKADPVSIFGGIVALSDMVDTSLALKLSKLFLEVIVAPKFTKEALQILQKKKNIRLLQISLHKLEVALVEYISLETALLVQQTDDLQSAFAFSKSMQCATQKKPSYDQLQALLFAWAVVKHVKSNAIVLAKKQGSLLATVSIGAGYTNRVEATSAALLKSLDKKQGKVKKGLVLASDAFFPMQDSVELAAIYNISAIIQPGGSIRDQDSINVCNENGISMLFTHRRHFLH